MTAQYSKSAMITRLTEKRDAHVAAVVAANKTIESQFEAWKAKRLEEREREVAKAQEQVEAVRNLTFGNVQDYTRIYGSYQVPVPQGTNTEPYDSAIAELNLIIDDVIKLQPNAAILKLIR